MAMVISGVSVYINKFAVGAIQPPLVFTATKNAMVGVLLVGMLLASGKWKKVASLSSHQVIKLIGVGVIGGALPFYLFFSGLAQISAVNAQLINKSLVLWVALLAIPWLKEKVNLWQVGAIGMLYSANLIVGGFGGFEFSAGELMVLGATLLWAVEHVMAKKVLASVDPDLVTGARMGLGSLLLLVAAQVRYPGAVLGVFSMSGTQWMWMLMTAAMLTWYVMSWYRALKYAPATLVVTVLVGATVVTNLLSAVQTGAWSGEMLGQAVMIAVGIGAFATLAGKNREVVEEVRA